MTRVGCYGLDSTGSEQRTLESSCEHGNEPSSCMKCWKIIEQLSDWRLLNKDSALRSLLVSLKWNRNINPGLVFQCSGSVFKLCLQPAPTVQRGGLTHEVRGLESKCAWPNRYSILCIFLICWGKPWNNQWFNWNTKIVPLEYNFWALPFRRGGTQLRRWLRRYATSQKVAGSTPDEVIEFFNVSNPSCRTMALGFTQPPTEMSTRISFWGKARPARRADNLTSIYEPIV
jgi:hypothetical protein